MPDDALYVYGIVKIKSGVNWKETGIYRKDVYIINERRFGALVHDCEEKPYAHKYPEKVKELIIAHNDVLNGAMIDFRGVIPLHFNTIIKKGKNSARYNLKKWLSDEQERLKKVWDKIKDKKEYGIRIYYEKDKLLQKASNHGDVKDIKKSSLKKGEGLNYLLESIAKSRVQEIVLEKVNSLKQEFYDDLKKVTQNLMFNPSKISIDEERDLLLSFSVLVDKLQIEKIKENLENKEGDFSFQLAGPFAPYSFVENGTTQ